MSEEAAVNMKEVELSEIDPEKQPMTSDGQEKNGGIKPEVPQARAPFTGLTKEELMKVADTPGWVRTRWALLILFWVVLVSMLIAVIVITLKAPRCKPIPDINWWIEGPLYQISDVEAFSEGIEGVEAKLDEISRLRVKGLVLGPFHTLQDDQPNTLNLEEIDPAYGTESGLTNVLNKAHKKGISVVLDLTPNYRGEDSWFSSSVENELMNRVKAAAEYWLQFGFDGIKISDFNVASSSIEWLELQAAVQGNRTDDTKKKALIGVVTSVSAEDVNQLINTTGVDLLLSDLLDKSGGKERIKAMDILSSMQGSVGWGLGAAQNNQLSKSTSLIRLYQLLLFTMPGTPVFTYGDEIGLNTQGAASPKMIWDIEKKLLELADAVNETAEAEWKEHVTIKKWFKSLSDLRGKERSLLHGDYYSLYSADSSIAFLRIWDQSDRYITAVNWGTTPEKLTFTLTPTEGVELPEKAKVQLSTDENLKVDSSVSLDSITLGPGQAVLLQFPYIG
ncbi:F2 cell-surface antigen heavy chain-like [Xyrichtys novacula]|uniref:F2 cell-surface antigen heavy chain-like n=1 Tax=Xyrichtys novacula TaxID=13765 RepID=A0AAV1HMW1_XYRNO|nr:F2 cell-surface antigen heavy chain-like [Xyrichtys novacula]